MGLRVDGGRGTTGRLSPVKAFIVDALALALIAVTSLMVLGGAFAIVLAVVR
jgi:hypothetical protein